MDTDNQIENINYIAKENIKLNSQKFSILNPFNTKIYLNNLYYNIEDIESFKNLNRIEWENRQEGNLEIIINS
jgi:hypothetical protein